MIRGRGFNLRRVVSATQLDWMVRKNAPKASTPSLLLRMKIEFFFELVPQGIAPDLYTLKLGDELFMRKVPGTIHLDTGHPGHYIHLLSGDGYTGVAPFVNATRGSFSKKIGKEGAFSVGPQALSFYSVRGRSWEFGYHEELSKIAEEMPLESSAFVPTSGPSVLGRPEVDR